MHIGCPLIICFASFSGQFCLTEVDHGLDAIHLETTATLRTDGQFELNTPHKGAAKYVRCPMTRFSSRR